MPVDPVALLRRHFGYPGFRPGQEALVRAALGGRDALGVLPTGGGKSVCYQVPALALGGLTLVVTPLVSLMEDQVVRAGDAGLRAAQLSASQDSGERRSTLARAQSGDLHILFVSPERLEIDAFRDVLRKLDVRLLAVDEAHCISEWGHDFRPAYRRISAVRDQVSCPVLALTATATPSVREDVARSLALRRPRIVLRSFDRPNLTWSVRAGGGTRARASLTGALLRRRRGKAIVYAPTRRSVERVRDALSLGGLRVLAYHAGLPAEERSRVQAEFMGGDCRVVVATNAFGMGIDKADVRTVVHVHLPGTLEAYYQEAGRAGRDGERALCVAFHARTDRRLTHSFIDRTHPPGDRLRRLHQVLLRHADAASAVDLVGSGLTSLAAEAAEWLEGSGTGSLAALERLGAIRRLRGRSGPFVGVRRRLDLATGHRLREGARAKARAVERYARSRGCRRRALLRYFGEEAARDCGRCDRCAPSAD